MRRALFSVLFGEARSAAVSWRTRFASAALAAAIGLVPAWASAQSAPDAPAPPAAPAASPSDASGAADASRAPKALRDADSPAASDAAARALLAKGRLAAKPFCPGSFWAETWGAPAPKPQAACWGSSSGASLSAKTLSDTWAFIKAQQSGAAAADDAAAAASPSAEPVSALVLGHSPRNFAASFDESGDASPWGFLQAAERPKPAAGPAAKGDAARGAVAAAAASRKGVRASQKAFYAKLETALATDPAARGPLRAALLATLVELSDTTVPGSLEKGPARLDEAQATLDADFSQWRENPTYWPLAAQMESDRLSLLEGRASEPGVYAKAQEQLAVARTRFERLFALRGEAPRSYQAQAFWALAKENFGWAIHPGSQQPYAEQSKAFESAVEALTLWKLANGPETLFWGEGSANAPSNAALAHAETELAALVVLRQAWLTVPAALRAPAAQCALGWSDDDAGCAALAPRLAAAAKALRQQSDTAASAPAPDDAAGSPDEQDEAFRSRRR